MSFVDSASTNMTPNTTASYIQCMVFMKEVVEQEHCIYNINKGQMFAMEIAQ